MKKLILYFVLLACAPLVFGQNVKLNSGKAASRNYYEEIPFEFIKNKIIIPVEINNKTYRFLLDTGAPNIISSQLAKEIGAKTLQKINVLDANAKADSLEIVNLPALKIGATVFENTPSIIYDLENHELLKCFKLDGFIGSNMLRNAIIQIDLEEKLLKLTDKRRKLGLKRRDGIKMALLGSQSSPHVWVHFPHKEKNVREQVLVDTGMDDFYDLSVKNYPLLESNEAMEVIGSSSGSGGLGIFGDTQADHVKVLIPNLKLHNTSFHNLTSITTNASNSRIGAEILYHGVLTLNFKNKKLYFHPYHKEVDLQKKELGFSPTIANNKLVVGFVWDEELKDKIKFGDEIVSINKVPVASLCELLTNQSALKQEESFYIEFKAEDGTLFSLYLEKQFPVFKNEKMQLKAEEGK